MTMKARRTTAAMDRPTRAPILGRENHRGAELQKWTLEAACCRRSVVLSLLVLNKLSAWEGVLTIWQVFPTHMACLSAAT